MSYSTYPPLYSTYQPGISSYSQYQPGHNHYPSQYPATPTTPATSSFSIYHQLPQPKSSPPPPDLPPPPPDLSSVTPREATKAVEKLLCAALRDAGFDAARSAALQRLQVEVEAFVERLYETAHGYANLSNRAGPIITDLMLACGDMQMQPKTLHSAGVNYLKKRKKAETAKASILLPPSPRSPSPVLLPSDDEDAQPVIPTTLRTLPPYFPSLPPKHTYLRTPPSPPKKATIPSLEKKLKTASLVQKSLKNLLLATEDSEGQEDAELLGHIVNWETGLHPRKRWRVSG